jgi:hypothetical protein
MFSPSDVHGCNPSILGSSATMGAFSVVGVAVLEKNLKVARFAEIDQALTVSDGIAVGEDASFSKSRYRRGGVSAADFGVMDAVTLGSSLRSKVY